MPSLWRTPRWTRFAVALAMLFGYAFADDAGQALAQDQSEWMQCANEASEKGFNSQESWAWGKICAGRPANMADYPETERTALLATSAGEPANRVDYPDTDKDNQPNCDPASQGEQAGKWPETRTLSPAFIEFIATHPRYTQVAVKRRARVECAIVNGQVDLSNKEVRPELIIAGSVMKGGITMADAHFLRSFSIERSSVTGIVNATGATFDRNFTLKEGVYEDINLDNARIKASLSLAASTITQMFTAQAMDADGGIDLKGMSFMKEVKLIDAKTAKELSIQNSAFKGELTAYNLGAGGDIFLERSTFTAKVDFADLMTAKQLSIERSAFKGEFVAYNLTAGGNILLEGTKFEGEVNLIGAQAAKQLNIKNSTFMGKLTAYNLGADGDIFLERSTFSTKVDFADLRTVNQLNIEHSAFKGEFVAYNLEAGGNILLKGTKFEGAVNLSDAETAAGHLDTDDSEFQGVFEAQRLDAGAGIFLENAAFKQGVYLNDAKTAGPLNTDYSEFQGVFEAQRLNAGAGILLKNAAFKQGVYLNDAKTAGPLDIDYSEFQGVFEAQRLNAGNGIFLRDTRFKGQVNLSLVQVNGMLWLVSSSFSDKLDLSQAHIANALVLYGKAGTDGWEREPDAPKRFDTPPPTDGADGREGESDVPVWGAEAELILDHSYAGVLQARMPDSWLVHDGARRSTSTLLTRSLNGFVYGSLHLTEGSELENERIRSLIEWAGGATVDHSKEKETFLNYAMKKLCLASEWRQEETPYKPQPYTQLAEKLYEIGAADQADRVLIARFHHYYDTHPLWLARAVGNISCFVSSYGVKPFRPLYLFIVLMFLWMPFNYHAYNLSRKRLRRGWTAAALFDFFACYLFRPLFHSFRNSIPIPGFLSYTKEAKPERLIYLLYAQKIIGLLLLASALGYLAI